MKKRLTVAQWAKVRFDRERNGFSIRDLAEKYGISVSTIHARIKSEYWDNPNEKPNEKTNTESLKKPLKSDSKKSNRTKNRTENRTDESRYTQNEHFKENRTFNRTEEDENLDSFQDYLDDVKRNCDPYAREDYRQDDIYSRTRHKRLQKQVRSIHENLTDLADAVDSNDLKRGLYRPVYCRIAYQMALLGATPEDLARTFNVAESTIYRWLDRYQEFAIAWEGGKNYADSQVAAAIYKRALGFSVVIDDYRTEKGNLVKVDKTLVFPPDMSAAMFWMTNRQSDKWKREVIVEAPINPAIIDHEQMDEMYNRTLQEAEDLQDELIGRAERLKLKIGEMS